MKDNDVGKMLVKYPWILSASILENFEKILDFFDEEKVLLEIRCSILAPPNLMVVFSVNIVFLMLIYFMGCFLGSKSLLLPSNQKLATYFGLFS